VLLASSALAPQASAEEAKPLLMEGKTTLYQRVLTRPGAELAPEPGEAGKPVPALSQFYVYERKSAAGKEWLRVGPGSRGDSVGWVAADRSLAWKQQMALAFTNPAGRDRTLLFRDRKAVADLLRAEDAEQQVGAIRKTLTEGGTAPSVLSIEPETHIDIDEQFYLLPILQAEQLDAGRGFRARVLEVASVSAKESPLEAGAKTSRSAKAPAAGGKAKDQPLRTFSAALVFVVDSTISMGPYIDRTREAVRQVYDVIEEAGLAKKVRFGLVAYRSSTEAVPGLDYVTRVYADPNEVKSGDEFLARVADLSPATVSSKGFDEDAYAGLLAAVEEIDWDRFGGRYVVLVTDAGAIEAESELSGTKLSAEQVRLELEAQGVALHVLHLKTKEGRRNHANAARQYKQVSKNPILDAPLYYGVDAGSVERFGSMVDSLAEGLVKQVRGAAKGEAVPGGIRAKKRAKSTKLTEAETDARIQEDLELLGRAMQLAYLGRVEGTTAPPLFRAWLSDRDFVQLDRATTEVRVLLTKNQLSDLAEVLETILDSGEKSQHTSSTEFFDMIRSAAASLARDPERLTAESSGRLGEMGILGEYLDGLPYKSDVMGLTPDIWSAWSTGQQEELLDKLRRKLRLYHLYDRDADRWIALAPGAPPGDSVYPVPLQALP